MGGVSIGPAETEEVETLTDMWIDLASGQRSYGSHLLASENRTTIREAISRHVVGDSVVVARDSDPVGFVMFTVENGTFDQDCLRGVVENIFVVRGRRGEGIGSALLGAAERRLYERGVDTVSLEVMARNDRALSFYRRQGYISHRVELEKRPESDTLSRGDFE
jgi:ribosomal protein S18 acetylase RimI-like enzyme